MPSEQLPPGVTRKQLVSLVQQLEREVAPANEVAYTREMTRLIEFGTAFGVQVTNPNAVFKIYRETLGKLPIDLLSTAISNVIATWKWGNRLPMPGDIMASVGGETTRRGSLLWKARRALEKAKDPDRGANRITAAQFEQLRDIIRGVAKPIASNSTVEVPENV